MTAASPRRTGQHRIAEEQAALRRVATLVARGASPEEVFTSVAEETGQLLGADLAGIRRYDPDGTAVTVGGWETASVYPPYRVGSSVRLGGRNVLTLVRETGRSARIDAVASTTGEPAAYARERRFGCVVG